MTRTDSAHGLEDMTRASRVPLDVPNPPLLYQFDDGDDAPGDETEGDGHSGSQFPPVSSRPLDEPSIDEVSPDEDDRAAAQALRGGHRNVIDDRSIGKCFQVNE